MIAALAFVLFAKQHLDRSFDAVWTDLDGVVLTLRSKGECQMMLGDRLISFDPPQQVPDGDFVGAWVGARTLDIRTLDPTPWHKVLKAPKSESVADFGEVRIAYGKQDASGVVNTLSVLIKDGNGAHKLNELFYLCAPIGRLNFVGKFSGSHRTLEILQDEPVSDDRSFGDSTIVGRVTFDDTTYAIKGIRDGSRATFEVVGADYDNVEGRGYCVWLPTDSRALKIMSRDEKQTDQILLYLKIKDLPNGGQALLKRASD